MSRCGPCLCGECATDPTRCRHGGPASSGGKPWACDCDHPSHQEGK